MLLAISAHNAASVVVPPPDHAETTQAAAVALLLFVLAYCPLLGSAAAGRFRGAGVAPDVVLSVFPGMVLGEKAPQRERWAGASNMATAGRQ